MAKKPKLGSGGRFRNFTNKLQREGYSEESAKAIAATVGRDKYGPKEMAALAEKGKKRR